MRPSLSLGLHLYVDESFGETWLVCFSNIKSANHNYFLRVNVHRELTCAYCRQQMYNAFELVYIYPVSCKSIDYEDSDNEGRNKLTPKHMKKGNHCTIRKSFAKCVSKRMHQSQVCPFTVMTGKVEQLPNSKQHETEDRKGRRAILKNNDEPVEGFFQK